VIVKGSILTDGFLSFNRQEVVMAQVIRKSLALILVLAWGVANAATPAPLYVGMFEAKSTAYNGDTFDRHFKVSVRFMPRADIIASAKVREQRVCTDLERCRDSDAYESQCNTYVNFELGKVLLRVRDIETGETYSEVLPWSAHVGKFDKKNGNEPCAPSNLEGLSAAGSVKHLFVLKSAASGTETSLYVEIEPSVAWRSPSELAMASTIRKLSGDTYYVAPFSPNTQAELLWQYTHDKSWGTSNPTIMKLKN
jgi:hypothetical protein